MKNLKIEKCSVKDCKNISAYVRKTNGSIYRRKICEKHYKLQHGFRSASSNGRWRDNIKYSPCSLCGWDRDKVDSHRIIHGKDGSTYKQENVIGLCPNCHRLVHSGIINL